MRPSRPHADPRLVDLLLDLLSEERLPALDRWFSAYAKAAGWPLAEQKRLWDGLRRALTRAYELTPSGTPEGSQWPGVRLALRGRASEWTQMAQQPAPAPSLASAGIPAWLAPSWAERSRRSSWSEEEQNRFLALQEGAAPVHVRFRAGAEGETARQRLRDEGATQASDVEGVDLLVGHRGLEARDEWKKGLVEIQDAASQRSLAGLTLRPGMRVWDLCAGRGGKTLWAASELRGKGALVATDVSERKLHTLKERVRRSGWQNIRILGWEGETLPDFGAEFRAKGGFDRVIVDVPCSAMGTWRRDPDGRFRLSPQGLEDLGRHQSRLLRLGWSALKPGGVLAYVTCSWLPEENEAVVEAFLPESGAKVKQQQLLGLPAFDANTMFVALLEKPQ